MKCQVVCDGKVLSTHKRYDLAERALKRWMKKQKIEDERHNEMVAWVDPKLVRRFSGIFHIERVA